MLTEMVKTVATGHREPAHMKQSAVAPKPSPSKSNQKPAKSAEDYLRWLIEQFHGHQDKVSKQIDKLKTDELPLLGFPD